MVNAVVLPALGSLNTKRAPLLFCHGLSLLRYFLEDIFGEPHIPVEVLIIGVGLRILDFIGKLRHSQWIILSIEKVYFFCFFRVFVELIGD